MTRSEHVHYIRAGGGCICDVPTTLLARSSGYLIFIRIVVTSFERIATVYAIVDLSKRVAWRGTKHSHKYSASCCKNKRGNNFILLSINIHGVALRSH